VEKITLIPIFILLIAFVSVPVKAQYDDLYGLSPEIGVGLDKLGYTTLRGKTPDRKCQGFQNQVGLTYPVGVGSPDLDKSLADAAQADFEGYLKEQLEQCPEILDTNASPTVQHRKTFRATLAGKRYLSLLFTYFKNIPYAAHPETTISAIIYDLTTQKPVEFADIFADPQKSLPGLWDLVAKGWCAQGHGSLPSYYGPEETNIACGSETPPLPEKFQADPTTLSALDEVTLTPTLSALGEVTLTPEGLTIEINAYEAWSYAAGIGRLDITKNALINLGAKKEIWE
jgi:hypothetical protein